MIGAIFAVLAASGKYAGTMTAGTSGSNTGLGSGYGSRSPTTLSDGKGLAILSDDSFNANCSLRISGFGADPGTAYLQYVIANGVIKQRGAASYSYSGGNATWTWAAQSFGFANTVTYQVVIA
jgi:hypothetical protein